MEKTSKHPTVPAAFNVLNCKMRIKILTTHSAGRIKRNKMVRKPRTLPDAQEAFNQCSFSSFLWGCCPSCKSLKLEALIHLWLDGRDGLFPEGPRGEINESLAVPNLTWEVESRVSSGLGKGEGWHQRESPTRGDNGREK